MSLPACSPSAASPHGLSFVAVASIVDKRELDRFVEKGDRLIRRGRPRKDNPKSCCGDSAARKSWN